MDVTSESDSYYGEGVHSVQATRTAGMSKWSKRHELSKPGSDSEDLKTSPSERSRSEKRRSEEPQSQFASCCLISKSGTKTGQGVIVRRGKWVEDVGGPSNCSLVLITSHNVIQDSGKAASDWHRICLCSKQCPVKFASCISCCGKEGILSKRSHGGAR